MWTCVSEVTHKRYKEERAKDGELVTEVAVEVLFDAVEDKFITRVWKREADDQCASA